MTLAEVRTYSAGLIWELWWKGDVLYASTDEEEVRTMAFKINVGRAPGFDHEAAEREAADREGVERYDVTVECRSRWTFSVPASVVKPDEDVRETARSIWHSKVAEAGIEAPLHPDWMNVDYVKEDERVERFTGTF